MKKSILLEKKLTTNAAKNKEWETMYEELWNKFKLQNDIINEKYTVIGSKDARIKQLEAELVESQEKGLSEGEKRAFD